MKFYMNSSIFHWSCQYFCLLFPPLPSLSSIPPSTSLHLFPLFFPHCEQLTAVSLKSLHVSWVVLSYPACTAAIWSSVGSGWADTFDVRRGKRGRTGRHYDASLYTPCYAFPVCLLPAVVIDLKRALFSPPSFFISLFSQSGPETVSIRLKNKEEKCWTDCVSRCIVPMWPRLVLTDESSNCQAERALCVCVFYVRWWCL